MRVALVVQRANLNPELLSPGDGIVERQGIDLALLKLTILAAG